MHRLALASAAFALFSCPSTGWAHDPGLSSSAIAVTGDTVTVLARFDDGDVARAVPAVDGDGDGRLCAAEVTAGRDLLLGFAARYRLLDSAGRSWSGRVSSIELVDDADLAIALSFVRPDGDQLRVQLEIWEVLPRGHRHFVGLHRGEPDQVLASALLERRSPAFAFTPGAAAPASSAAVAAAFLVLGVEHILLGFDHILFLLALLTAAPGLAAAIRLITAFTVAHSLTLVAATLEVLALPGSIVEPAIALSIVWVAVENLVRRAPRHRWSLTFAFGLVHGFGFASVLADLGIGRGASAVVPLLSFNVGVEVGQVAIAAVFIPLLSLLRRRPWFVRFGRPGICVALAGCGAFWLLQRTLFG